MTEFLDFAEMNHDQWEVGEKGQVIFATDELLAQYNKLMDRLNAIAAEQEDLQKRIFSLGAKG